MKARRFRQHQTGSCNILLQIPTNYQQPLHTKTLTVFKKDLPSKLQTLGCQPGTLLLPKVTRTPSIQITTSKTNQPHKQNHYGAATPADRLKQIRRSLQHKNTHRKKLCKVFEKWDTQAEGGLNYGAVKEMMGEIGVGLSEEEAKDFISTLQGEDGGEILTLTNFLKTVEEPKRMSYFLDKSGIPLQLLQTKQLQACGGYQSRISKLSQTSNSINRLSSSLASFDKKSLRASLLTKYRLNQITSDLFRKNANNLTAQELEKYSIVAERLKKRIRKNYGSKGEFERRVAEECQSDENREKGVGNLETLRGLLKEMSKTEKEGEPSDKEVEAFLCLFQANPYQQIPLSDISYAVYQQNSLNVHHRLDLKKNGPAPPVAKRGASIQPFNRQSLNISVQTVQKALYAGSIPSFTLFRKLDKDNDGYVSKADLNKHLSAIGVKEQDTVNMFELLNRGAKDMDSVTYTEFSKIFRPGMGIDSKSEMYPVLRPTNLNISKSDSIDQSTCKAIRRAISIELDPRSTHPSQQYKTRLGATPKYENTFLPREVYNWGKNGDLNQKVEFQQIQKLKQQKIRAAKQEIMRFNRGQEQDRKESQDHELARRKQIGLHCRGLQAWAYEHTCQLNNQWR